MTTADEKETEVMRRTVPFATALGVEVITNRPDEVRARVEWRPERCTIAGVLHGGVIMSLADTTGATCAVQNLPEGAAGTTTIESKTNFLAAAPVGSRLVGETTPVHRGRTTMVWQTRIATDAGRLVALVTQTQLMLPPKP
jgi:uncharacterized protein (TIGR00369 family)